MEAERTELREGLLKLETALTSMKERSAEFEEENTELKKKIAEETGNLQQQVNVLTTDLKVTVTRAETCVENEKRAKEISESQKSLAAEVGHFELFNKR